MCMFRCVHICIFPEVSGDHPVPSFLCSLQLIPLKLGLTWILILLLLPYSFHPYWLVWQPLQSSCLCCPTTIIWNYSQIQSFQFIWVNWKSNLSLHSGPASDPISWDINLIKSIFSFISTTIFIVLIFVFWLADCIEWLALLEGVLFNFFPSSYILLFTFHIHF